MEKGDYVYDANTGVSFILKSVKERYHSKVLCESFCAIVDGVIAFDYKSGLLVPPFNVNNPEIIDELDKALFKEGYYFDTEKLEMSEKRWVPEIDEEYCIPYHENSNWKGGVLDMILYEKGFVCETYQEADKLMEISRDAIRKYLTNKK